MGYVLNYLSTYHLIIINEIDTKLLLPIESLTFIIIFAFIAFRAPNSLQMAGFSEYGGRMIVRYDLRYAFVLASFIFASFLSFVGDVPPSDFLYFNF